MANGSGVCSYPGDISMIDIADRFKDGGQAFPSEGWDGMTLRDWFAGQALSGRMMSDWGEAHEFAQHAYRIADAMLKERTNRDE